MAKEIYLDTELSTTDLRDVKIKLRNAAFDNTEWRKLGEELGLRKGTMNVISKNNPGDTERCYTECLTKWLERADDVDDCHGKPTLRLLADALDNINLTQVADKIRKSTLTSQSTKRKLPVKSQGGRASKIFKPTEEAAGLEENGSGQGGMVSNTTEEAAGVEETDSGGPPEWNDDHNTYEKFYKKFAENLVEGIKILLMPATPTEEEQVLRYLEPKEDEPSNKIIRTTIKNIPNHIYIGKYGSNPVIVVMTAPHKSKQGPIEAAIIATRILEKVKSIKYVVAVGVCFGIDREKHNLGDVIVSSIVCNFTNKREGLDELGKYQRGGQTDVGNNISREFCPLDDLKMPNQIKVYCGPVISTASLIDNPDIKQELLDDRQDAYAGEMEGAGIMAAIRYTPGVEAIVIKGIGDWGDGTKDSISDKWKPYAARAAAYYVKTVLDKDNLD